MTIWVDADACPGAVKELIIRAARRLTLKTVFVANKYISVPDVHFISHQRIGMDLDEADRYIREHAEEGDLAVTQDIPLASELAAKGVVVIGPRGELFTKDNVGERLSVRNMMQDIREAGGVTPGPRQFDRKDRQRFADTLDRELGKLLRHGSSRVQS
ncbi:MAG: YaiI/YqxD family protein [Desulfobacteraceae bacterium]|nr:YaiI/YqxD family protein [Desulfobacteraceae bacterium]